MEINKNMEMGLKKLVEISNHYGNDPEYVIAGGGNTSFKDEKYLWIKASGTSLASITEDGFVKMDRRCLGKIAEKTYSGDPLKREAEIIKELFACVAENSSKRPSVETSLHNLINFKFVVHTHPTLVNGLMCSKNSKAETKTIFGDRALLIEYTDPGYILFKLVEKEINGYVKKFKKEPQIIFLENHGVFVSSNSLEEIMEIYSDIMQHIGKKTLHPIPSSAHLNIDLNSLEKALSAEYKLVVRSFNSKLINEFTKDLHSFIQVNTAFSPDNIVYCKAHYLLSKNNPKILLNDTLSFKNKYGYLPRVIGIENTGILCMEESDKSVSTVYEVFLDMLKISFYTRNFGGPRFMTPEQIEFIDSWEVENYRRKIAKNINEVTK
jgi:rhamnose utilization protein RhaD (predicted bifunctional aldolase and dehydrogenase)